MIRHIPGPAGRLEALLDEPTSCSTTGVARGEQDLERASPLRPRAGVVLAHPHPLYGGTMNTKVVYHAAKAFCGIGCAVLRFNFRGVGTSEGTFEQGVGEREDFRAAVDFLARHYPGTHLWAAGVSFGAWVALSEGATDARSSVLLGIAAPLNAYDFTQVRASLKPKFLIHGERDEICPLATVRRFYAELQETKELVVIDGADHLFDGKVSEVADAIADLLQDFNG
jgi:hypothetical protein